MIGEVAAERLIAEVRAALRRRSAHEARLSGTLRVLACHSSALASELVAAVDTMARRGTLDRPLYAAAVRALAECGDERLAPVLVRALAGEDGGGLPTLGAACFSREASLTRPLAQAAMSRHPVVAFAAEIARISRGESEGRLIAALAPKIKEAHRIALCSELFVSLLWRRPLPLAVAPALAVLRDAERHLGRWLLLGEVATLAGDPKPLAEAQQRARSGPTSARAAWSLVAWALEPNAAAPTTRPTVELIARLSDRPSADRDGTFLFRMAAAKAPSARLMLEGIAKGSSLGDDAQLRAALHLCRDYGQASQVVALAAAGKSPKKDALRGLAAAGLYDCGEHEKALALAAELDRTRYMPALGWAALVRATAAGARSGALVSEANFRRVQQGFSE